MHRGVESRSPLSPTFLFSSRTFVDCYLHSLVTWRSCFSPQIQRFLIVALSKSETPNQTLFDSIFVAIVARQVVRGSLGVLVFQSRVPPLSSDRSCGELCKHTFRFCSKRSRSFSICLRTPHPIASQTPTALRRRCYAPFRSRYSS